MQLQFVAKLKSTHIYPVIYAHYPLSQTVIRFLFLGVERSLP